jgi:PKD repeat protein
MRVMSDYAGSTYDACTYMDRGQAEDYTITMIPNTSPPLVNFAVDTAVSCRTSFIFADSTDNVPTSWLWTFGDGSTSTVQNPNHSYASPGIYTVKLKACNAFGCDSLSKNNYINYTSFCAYCAATGNYNYYTYISNVSLGTINNSSGTDANGYGNYSSISTNVLKGSSYNISISSGYNYLSAWIDYNRDGVFGSSEQVISSVYSYGTYSSSIIIPSGASTGTTGMRILASYDYYQSNNPCGGNISDGEVEDYTINIVSNTSPPLPDFSSANTTTCSSLVNFTDATTGTVTSRLWSFGDGTTSTLQSPSHTYSGYGTYTVKLKTCNSYGCDSVTKNNYISYSAVCPYCSVNGSTYSYDYISYVSLNTISNYTNQSASGYGNYTSVSTNLTQGLNYTIGVSDGNYYGAYYNAWIDYNKDGIFSTSEQIINTYQYYFASAAFTVPGNATPGTTRMRVILNTSNYSTSCASYIDGEVEDYTINIIQNTLPPVTDFSANNPVTCTSTVIFTDATANNPTSWLWNFGDGTTSTLQSPSHTYSGYGTYTVKLKTCNTYGCDSITKSSYISYSAVCPYCTASGNAYSSDYISYVILNSIINSTGQSASGYGNYTSVSTNLTQGLNYTLDVYDGGYSGVYYNAWIDYNHDNIFTSSEQILNTYQYYSASAGFTIPGTAMAGTTRMRVILNTSNYTTSCASYIDGEVEDYTINIILNTLPPVTNFSANNPVTCTSTVAFTDSSANTLTSWLWNFGDGTTSTLQSPSHTYSGYGTYTVKLKTCNTYGCDSMTKSNYISYSALCPYCSVNGTAYSYDYIS